MKPEELMRTARAASEKAYAPYSHFRVGAALLLVDGTVVTGVNVENRSFGLSNCAERTALFTALAQGRQEFAAIAIAAPDGTGPTSPCGACRQVMTEFCEASMPVYYDDGEGGYVGTTLSALFPGDALHDLKDR